jgi:germination protein M
MPPQGFYNPIPYGTELLSISVSGGVCYVDLSGKFVPADGTVLSERAAVWALVSTLTELDNISSVLLTIEGESSGFTSVDISEPLTEESVQLN